MVCTAEIHAQRYGFTVTVMIMVTVNGYGHGSRSLLWDDFSEFIDSLNNKLETVSLRGSPCFLTPAGYPGRFCWYKQALPFSFCLFLLYLSWRNMRFDEKQGNTRFHYL